MTTAGPITPDTKDWTWVLDRPCPECGYDASTVAVADLPHRIRANAVVWLALMGEPEVAVRPEPGVWSPAGVRLPRPRRAPGLPRAADRDDDRARAAVRQLGPGRDRRRAALRPAGARDRRADAGGLGVRRRRRLRVGPGRRLGPQGRPQRRQRLQHRLARALPPPRHRAPPARRGDAGRAGHHRLLRRVRRASTPPAPAPCPTRSPTTSTTSSTSSAPRRGCWRSAAVPAATPLALEQIGLSVRRTDISRGFVQQLRARRVRRRPARPAPRRPHRHAARRGAVRRRLGQRVAAARRARGPADRARAGWPPSPGPAAPCT